MKESTTFIARTSHGQRTVGNEIFTVMRAYILELRRFYYGVLYEKCNYGVRNDTNWGAPDLKNGLAFMQCGASSSSIESPVKIAWYSWLVRRLNKD